MSSLRAGPKSCRSTTTSVRAVRAADGMIAYARRCGTGTEELPTVFADFLGDAHHLADALGVDSVMPHAMGRGIFAAELYGTG